MTAFAKPIALAALGLTILPPLWYLGQGLGSSAGPVTGWMTDDRLKAAMLLGTILWFLAAPFWLKEDRGSADGDAGV